MVIHSETPAAIEGLKILVTGQKIMTGRVPLEVGDGDFVYPLSIKIRGDGTIREENNPKVAKFKDYSLLNVNDKISGSNLWGFTSDPLSPGSITPGGCGRSGSHPGQELTINGVCFIELIQGWRGPPLIEHPRNQLSR